MVGRLQLRQRRSATRCRPLDVLRFTSRCGVSPRPTGVPGRQVVQTEVHSGPGCRIFFTSAHEHLLEMAALQELATAVRTRRTEMGLTQAALAELSGLSRATISQVEQGTVNDLGLGRTEKLLGALGLAIGITHPQARPSGPRRTGTRSPLTIAAASTHTSTRTSITPKQIADALSTGRLLPRLEPQMLIFLDELPLALLAAVVDQVHEERGTARETQWSSIRKFARQLKSHRAQWA